MNTEAENLLTGIRELKKLSKEDFFKVHGATEKLYEQVKNSKAGWISIKRQSDGVSEKGMVEAFGEGLSCVVLNPNSWWATSNIESIDWENHTFKTKNSIYDFEFKPYGYIYKITNNVNNKCYIGKRVSKTFDAKCWGSGKLIKAAIAKYGKENFTREIMCWAGSKEELEELEKLYIDKFQTIYNGYNLTEDSTDNVTTNDSIEITNSVDERHVYTELGITDGFIKEVD